MRIAPVGFVKQSPGYVVPLLFEVGRIATFAVALQFHADDSLTRWNHPADNVAVRFFAGSIKNGVFGARVLIQEKIVTALILDRSGDEFMDLLRGKRRFGMFAVIRIRLIRRRPCGRKSHSNG
jgi:hypothetical protein